MIRSLWPYIKSFAIEDLIGANSEAPGEMYNSGAFHEDTKALPN